MNIVHLRWMNEWHLKNWNVRKEIHIFCFLISQNVSKEFICPFILFRVVWGSGVYSREAGIRHEEINVQLFLIPHKSRCSTSSCYQKPLCRITPVKQQFTPLITNMYMIFGNPKLQVNNNYVFIHGHITFESASLFKTVSHHNPSWVTIWHKHYI